MIYEVLGGGRIEAASPVELVEALRQLDHDWIHSVSVEDFMADMADRCKLQTGAVVRTDTMVNFLHDLQSGGFITPVPIEQTI
ncbi:hypothetical protein MUN81_10505 [Hymenobacter sp. 5317J-9]|uniref:hypothetical protein n=1 Tax=Hymenobacter sp. 5317J-9 TaxID=2932250 RepID=UPI001FD72406|nr:hypothetical protein [Hymenobacter sp. 5317J-9]UOQ99910.1 hypothetical protein MUN81_10505 [Hymenobacter sp. 5317J-9]